MWIRIDAVGENVIYRKAFSFSLGRRWRPLYGSPALAVRPDIINKEATHTTHAGVMGG